MIGDWICQWADKIVRNWLILDVLVSFFRLLVIRYSVVALNNLSPFVFICMLYELDAAAFCPTSFAFLCPSCFYLFFNDDRYMFAAGAEYSRCF